MAKKLLLFFILTVVLNASAQTQQGYVKTKGRLGNNGNVIAGSRIQGATIQIKGRTAVLSQADGTFSIPIPAQKFYLQNVQKQGFVLTDPDILSRQHNYSADPLVLVMEDKAQQEAERRAIERKISRKLYAELEKRQDEIDALLEQNKISEEKYRELLQELDRHQDDNERIIKDMALRYSRIDFDNVDDFNRRISNCIINGHLTEADSLLRTKGDVNDRYNKLNEHHKANVQARAELEKSEEMEKKNREDLAQDCYNWFEVYKMKHQNDSAAYYIELRADLDTTNFEWILDAGVFLRDYCANYSKALSYFQKVHDLSIIATEGANEWTAISLVEIGGLHEELGEFSKARDYFAEALAQYKALNFDNTIDIATCYNDIGTSYTHSGMYQEALDYCQKSLNIKIKLLGERDLEVARSLNNIGSIYSELGNYEKAIEFFYKALDIRKNYDEDSADLAGSYNNIGSLLCKQGLHEEALEFFEKALSINKRRLGTSHPHLAYALNNIGYTYNQKGDHEKALQYYIDALSIRIKIFGEQHPSLSTSYNNIALIYKKHYKDYDKAIEYYTKSLKIKEKYLGMNHPEIGDIYNNIGGVFLSKEDYDKALEYYLLAETIYTENYGADHPDLAICLANIGRTYRKTCKQDQAYEYLSKAASIIERSKIQTLQAGIIYANFGNVLFDRSDYERALLFFEKAIDILEIKIGLNNQTTKNIKDSIKTIKENMIKNNKY